MADFFKGLAGGMQTGLQFGRAIQERQERERLREAMGLTPQEIAPRPPTEDELNRAIAETEKRAADDARMFATESSLENRTGLYSSNPAERPLDASFAPQMPYVGQKVGGTQYRLGDQTLNRMPTQQEIEAARYSAAANVLAERDPVAAARMRQEQVRMQRENELFPLQRQQLETQVAAGKLGLTKTEQDIESGTLTLAEKKRQEEAAKNMNNFNTAFAAANAKAREEGRTLGPRDIADLAKAANLSYSQENELIASQVGRAESEVKQFRLDVEKLTQGKSHDQLIELHKNDKRFGDGMHFVSEVDKKTGKHILARVNEATGQVEERLPFKSKAEATAYLMEEARNPANAAVWLQNYQKGAAAIGASEASAQKDKAMAGLYAQGGKGGLKQKVSDFKEVYKRDPTEAEMGVLAGLVSKDPNKPEFTPEKYAATVKDFTAAGFSPTDALIKADQLYGRGPNTAKEDAALVKDNAAKGGPATPAKPAVGLTPQQREQVKPATQPARAPTTLDAIQSANIEAVSPLAAQFKQARAKFIQAAQSQDPNAIAYYMNQQNDLRKQLESEVARRFGNNAQTVMQQLAGSM